MRGFSDECLVSIFELTNEEAKKFSDQEPKAWLRVYPSVKKLEALVRSCEIVKGKYCSLKILETRVPDCLTVLVASTDFLIGKRKQVVRYYLLEVKKKAWSFSLSQLIANYQSHIFPNFGSQRELVRYSDLSSDFKAFITSFLPKAGQFLTIECGNAIVEHRSSGIDWDSFSCHTQGDTVFAIYDNHVFVFNRLNFGLNKQRFNFVKVDGSLLFA